jgi:hypothetical protein
VSAATSTLAAATPTWRRITGVFGLAWIVLVGSTPAELPDSTIRLLLVLDAVAIAAIGLPMALTAIGAATVIWTTGVLPRWLAPLAATSGLFSIVGATFVAADHAEGPLFFMRFAGLIAFGVFVAATSVHLISRPAATRPGREGG